MPDHLLESGDSPELEALFDRVAYQGQTPRPHLLLLRWRPVRLSILAQAIVPN